jgi:lipid A ethanolaminephosphotransferase
LKTNSTADKNNADNRSASSKYFALRPLKQHPEISVETLAILASVFFSIASNYLFFHAAMKGRDWSDVDTWLFFGGVFVAITSLHAVLLLVILNRWSAKPVLAVLLLITAGAEYYMQKYTVFFDTDMIRNVLQTDVKEANELLSPQMLIHLVLLGGVPCIALWHIRLQQRPWRRALLIRVGYIVGAIALTVVSVLLVFQDFSSLMRNQKEVRFLINPGAYLVSFVRVLAADTGKSNEVRIPISDDAKLNASWAERKKPTLFVFVVGETTRAANWGLNGYVPQTTPELSKQDIVNFRQVKSCGTNTAVSVPCMFSPYGRHNYDEAKIRAHESLLHIVDHVGFKTLWRDNQAGCKGVCEGLEEQRLGNSTNPALCNGTRCLDEIMLEGLDDEIKKAKNGNMFIVLHQLGNHGPAYYSRYPKSMRTFTPTCDTSDLSKCSKEEIVNTYDNAVLYTDHFVSKTIDFLKKQTDFNTALLYVSDHGESLGENGIYLHGLPYSIAPKEQTQVPMVMWMSQDFSSSFGIDKACLQSKVDQALSHDNLFHSVLGLLQIQSKYYDRKYDFTADCRPLASK